MFRILSPFLTPDHPRQYSQTYFPDMLQSTTVTYFYILLHAKHCQAVITWAEIFFPRGYLEERGVSEPDNIQHVRFREVYFLHTSQRTCLKKKKQKPGNNPRLSSETFSTGSCQLLHGLCMVLELSHLAAKLTSPLAQPVKMCCFISKRYRHTGRKKCLHIKKQKKPLSHILHPCIRNIHYYLA